MSRIVGESEICTLRQAKCKYCRDRCEYRRSKIHTDKVVIYAVKRKEPKGIMDRIDEIIVQFDKVECPKDYEQCPVRVAGNDCDNFCAFPEAADMLRELKKRRESDAEN